MTFGSFNGADETKCNESDLLIVGNILTGEKSVDKNTAIHKAGQLLADNGFVLPGYINSMYEREKLFTTYIGNGIAIPHGMAEAKNLILKSGISVVQYPDGVVFGEGKVAYLVIGIAATDDEHMQILVNLAELVQDEEKIKELFATSDRNKIYKAFTGKRQGF